MDFQLIETMRVSGGDVYLLDRHLERLRRSAAFFTFKCDLEIVRETILQATPRENRSACLRLTLGKDGVVKVQCVALPAGNVQRLKLSSVRVDSNDVFLYHKTTIRGIYDRAREECDAQTDALLINERDEITETTIMNVAVLREGQWITPVVTCGLLPGVMRDELLARGEVVEGVIRAEDIRDGEYVRCFNALRGDFRVVVTAA
jgi:para-aminobenzoate synthetase/4-amino-4-deoxychorismate lyase